MYDEKEKAYAVIVDDKIDVRTVSDTRHAAIVNWLVVECLCPIYTSTTDEQIEQIWSERSGDAFIAAVEISRSLPAF